ncbi:hypothetical protein PVV74_11895 [Roseovarius sp. SK2]|uniref:hypothetical protein n=1 Tax=Roseovarius TaxID=74030 RepID=UPI00237B2ED8|nr:hypothetical protein [Roseovarius sp. SK2]MDD9726160.1 hypothetical protein [Roseovarius sp. SK2]
MVKLLARLCKGAKPTKSAQEVLESEKAASWKRRCARLEGEISAIGRTKVFARAKAHGWSQFDTPPIWVWEGICREMRAEEQNVNEM